MISVGVKVRLIRPLPFGGEKGTLVVGYIYKVIRVTTTGVYFKEAPYLEVDLQCVHPMNNGRRCECGGDSISSPFHSDWCGARSEK